MKGKPRKHYFNGKPHSVKELADIRGCSERHMSNLLIQHKYDAEAAVNARRRGDDKPIGFVMRDIVVDVHAHAKVLISSLIQQGYTGRQLEHEAVRRYKATTEQVWR